MTAPNPRSRDWTSVLAPAAIVAAGAAAYAASFRGAFLLDDAATIVENPGVRRLWPLWEPFLPGRADSTAAGRPLANFTFALNYALSGQAVWSYHAFNLAVHLLAGLALFGIVRRTVKFHPDAVAFTAALFWVVHPLQTEAVTYIVQRTESLMGLFYLLTLYCFIRYSDETLTRSAPNAKALARPDTTPKTLMRADATSQTLASERSGTRKRFVNGWAVGSITCCLLGMATKEVMATAPVAVLLYDRTFVAGTFAEAWRRRRGYYAALAATWLPLAALVASTGWSRGGTAGYRAGAGALAYGLTQIAAIAHYLRLCLWPRPLVFDYGAGLVSGPGAILLPALLLGLLLAATAAGLTRHSGWGYLGAWFFLTLLPSSSVVPVATQTMAEHRMYLALAAPAVAAALGLCACLKRRFIPAALLLACLLGTATARRNALYASPEALWAETAAAQPGNDRAHTNLGSIYLNGGRIAEAQAEFETALRIYPGDPVTRFDLAGALLRLDRGDEAIAQYRLALQAEPRFVPAHLGLGQALALAGRIPEAIEEFEAALRLNPGDAMTRNGVGNLLLQSGRGEEAIAQYRAALRIDPGYLEARNNLGTALTRSGRFGEAVEEFSAALRIDPGVPEVHYNLGNALRRAGRKAEAVAEFQAALRLRPDYPKARRALERLQ